MKFNFEKYKIPDHSEDLNYGGDWPEGTSILAKELCGFSNSFSSKKIGRFKSRYYHGLKAIQLLWPDTVELYKDMETPKGKVRIFNNYFLDEFKFLCENRSAALTGPASSAKTYTTALYCLLCFYSDPKNTSILISTTSSSASERRVWADIKSLHDRARFKQNGFPAKYGTIIPYLKCITFDVSEGADRKQVKDLRNGIVVIPIANDSTGEKALETIMGTKNKKVIWVVDELPVMPSGTLRARTSLIPNLFFQFIGIGNAYRRLDQHGILCQPKNGWETLTLSRIEEEGIQEWSASTCNVLFLHGKRSPNFHPALSHLHEKIQLTEERIKNGEDIKWEDEITPEEFPFPYLANPYTEVQIAITNDPLGGNPDTGRKTIDYMRYAIGYWAASGVENVTLTYEQVKQAKANNPLDIFSSQFKTDKFAALDPAFTLGGDNCSLAYMERGRNTDGKYQFQIDVERIIPTIEQGEDFKQKLGKSVVNRLDSLGVSPDCFGMDISGDGGIIAQNISKAWDTYDIMLISSLGKSSNEKYYNRVTEYWMNVAKALQTGEWRGFDLSSGYARDFFQRTYQMVGRDVKQILPKKDFKKAFGYSPDDGDAVSYVIYVAECKGGLFTIQLTEAEFDLEEKARLLSQWFGKSEKEEEEFAFF